MFNSFQLSDRVGKNNFYYRLEEALDLDYLYSFTSKFYGSSGQKRINPVKLKEALLLIKKNYKRSPSGIKDGQKIRISARELVTRVVVIPVTIHSSPFSCRMQDSPKDPDSRISVKPGKARKLNYLSQLSVDTGNHVITDIKAYHADCKNNLQLPDIIKCLQKRLWQQGMVWENCVADTGYSSGENYTFLESRYIKSFIPPHGTYKGSPEGFEYNETEDYNLCPKKKIILFTKEFLDYRTKTRKKEYRVSKKICASCPLRKECLKSSQEKRITVTYYEAEYERNIARVNSKQGRYIEAKR